MCLAYSVLTHEEVIDIAWNLEIQPLLLKRFPDATPEEIRKAHAYAYGGCVVHDMGYYPMGTRYFSDLVHYVRSGDFVGALLEESSNLDEYAFALGALAHYASDNAGHPSINRVVALTFPKLRGRFGPEVTYEDDPKAHIQTEFGFDVVQVAKGRYSSDNYHDFIGFEVSKPVLERAFLRTYGTHLEDVFGHLDVAIGTFRRSVSTLIPEMTRVALAARRLEIVKDTPNLSEKEFLWHVSRADYEKEWGTTYRRPGLFTRILAFIFRLIPKIGPLKTLDFKIPSQAAEAIYIESVNQTVDTYRHLLEEAGEGRVHLANRDFDTGRETRAGEYGLTDATYARLLHSYALKGFEGMPLPLRADLLAFFSRPEEPTSHKKMWRRALGEAEVLRAAGGTPAVIRDPVLPPH